MSFRHFSKPLTAAAFTMLAGYAVGCASTPPPPELLDARSAYIRAESGPASQLKPASLHEAKVALEKAERAYADDPGSWKTRDVAYLAIRRAELAEVEGRDAKTQQEKARAEQELAGLTQTQLSHARQQLASASERLGSTEQQLASERAAREAAEKRAREAMDRLAATAAASIKEESRGTVITIPGSVLFASAKSSLLPTAQAKLNAVADALKDQADREIIVEGHTDSQGSEASNMELSQQRAQSVREYLVSRGVPTDRIRAQGVGESRPIANNASVEGRANNRRVEIIVSPASQGPSTTGSSGRGSSTQGSSTTGTSGTGTGTTQGSSGTGTGSSGMGTSTPGSSTPGSSTQGAGTKPSTGNPGTNTTMPTDRKPPAGGSSNR
jgi:outer membrane protein OmpA-like peptidoglycan-associated protein